LGATLQKLVVIISKLVVTNGKPGTISLKLLPISEKLGVIFQKSVVINDLLLPIFHLVYL
jgi:hypothetical protein